MSSTLLLDRTSWDLCIDAKGNIALASDPYSIAQDAASAIKLFIGEYYYDVALGIPYFEEVLGHNPPINLIKQFLISAAQSVPGVEGAIVYLSSIVDGQVSGQVQITNAAGTTTVMNF